MKAIIKYLSFMFFILFFGSMIACGGGGGGGDEGKPLKISGSLGTGYTPASGTKAVLTKADDTIVDKVVAIPIEIPFVASPEIIEDSVTADVNQDGSFNLTVDTSKNWVLLMINSSLPRTEQIVSFAALGDTVPGSETMILLPGTDATSDIDMGTLDKSSTGDEGVQTDSMTANESSFSLNITQLRQIAQSDNLLKTIKNIYINYDPDTGKFYSLLLVFNWKGDSDDCKNKFSDPAAYTFNGYAPLINSRNDNTFTYSEVKSKDYYVTIRPPAQVTGSDEHTYDFITSEGCTLIDEDRGSNGRCLYSNNPPFAFSIDGNGWLQIAAGGISFTNIVADLWYLQKTLTDHTYTNVAAFDIGVCSPINATSKKPFVYLPSLKINVDADDNVTSLEIKWYIYNEADGHYDEVTDISGFTNLMEWVGLSFNDWQNPGNEERCDLESVTTTKIIPKKTWKYTGTATGVYDIGALRLGYRVYGVDFNVSFTTTP